jgi:hypothetical protein
MNKNELKYECVKLMETTDAACMKWVSILLFVASISIVSCAINGKNKMTNQNSKSNCTTQECG